MSIDLLDKAHRQATQNMATKWADTAGIYRGKMIDAQVALDREIRRLVDSHRGDTETQKNLAKISEMLNV